MSVQPKIFYDGKFCNSEMYLGLKYFVRFFFFESERVFVRVLYIFFSTLDYAFNDKDISQFCV